MSTKAQYGLRALIEIARSEHLSEKRAVPLKDVAERQGLSQHYLEQIASILRRGGFVKSVRGAYGGYRLSRPPEQISAYDVVVALEGSIAPVECVEEDHVCNGNYICGTFDLWQRVDQAIKHVLGTTTLADLVADSERLEHSRLVQLEPIDSETKFGL